MSDSCLTYAVFVEDADGCFYPVSYGDDEYECRLWFQEHREQFKCSQVFIGYIFDLVP